MRALLIAALLLTSGCTGNQFTDLGNGTTVPTKSIDKYAEEYGLTPEQARHAMLKEDEARKRP